jgi:ATP-binding protein involved in chromosome partitioning
VGADEGVPLVISDPDAPASQAMFHAARGLIAATSQQIPVLQPEIGPAPAPPAPPVTGTALPMAR